MTKNQKHHVLVYSQNSEIGKTKDLAVSHIFHIYCNKLTEDVSEYSTVFFNLNLKKVYLLVFFGQVVDINLEFFKNVSLMDESMASN